MLLIPLTIVLGLLVRFAALGFPAWLRKYGGSLLWATLIYWIAGALLPKARPAIIVAVAFACAAAVELFKLYSSPSMDHFRETLAGKLLLGRFFSGWDFCVYAIGILLAAAIDFRVRG